MQKHTKVLVEVVYDHGLCVSYVKRAQLVDAAVSSYQEKGVVCPPVLRKRLLQQRLWPTKTIIQ